MTGLLIDFNRPHDGSYLFMKSAVSPHSYWSSPSCNAAIGFCAIATLEVSICLHEAPVLLAPHAISPTATMTAEFGSGVGVGVGVFVGDGVGVTVGVGAEGPPVSITSTSCG